MRIHVDMDLCENHGQCVFAAPDVFAFDDDDYLHYESEPPAGTHDVVHQAVRACPARAITIVEETV